MNWNELTRVECDSHFTIVLPHEATFSGKFSS
jgi:hypothetical protein